MTHHGQPRGQHVDVLRATFDGVAERYDEMRPGYPEALFDDVIALSGIPDGGRILEVGCGTGQATLPFARRGYGMLCVELGQRLAEVARQNLSAYSAVEIVTANFETWPAPTATFDLAISATAFHWIAPDIGYPKLHETLKPDAALALFWNRPVRGADGGEDDFFEVVQEVYRREAPDLAATYTGLPWPDAVRDRTSDIARAGCFRDIQNRRYLWHEEHDAASYIRLLDTYSDHRALPEEARQRLFAGIAALINARYGGAITKWYVADLYVAQRA